MSFDPDAFLNSQVEDYNNSQAAPSVPATGSISSTMTYTPAVGPNAGTTQPLPGAAATPAPQASASPSAAPSPSSGNATPTAVAVVNDSSSDDPYMPFYRAASKATGIPINLLQAQAKVESGGNPKAVSPKGAVGLFQVEPQTAAGMGITGDLTNPATNIMAGAKYLAQGLKAYGGNMAQALKYYHGGPDQTKWGPLTNAYPNQVFNQIQTAPSPNQTAFNQNDFLNSQVEDYQKTYGQPASESDTGPGISGTVPSASPAAPVPAQPLTAAQQQQLDQLKAGVLTHPAVATPVAQPGQSLTATPQATAVPAPVQPNVNPGWGPNQELAQKMLLGGARPLASIIGAGGALLSGGNPYATFQADQAEQLQAQRAWEAAHPGETTAASVLGPIPLEAVGGGLATGAIRAVAPYAEAVSPYVGAAARMLGGQGGAAAKLLSPDPLKAIPGTALMTKLAAGGWNGMLEGGVGGALGAQANPNDGSTEKQAAEGGAFGGVLGGVGGLAGNYLVPGLKAGYGAIVDGLDKLGIDLPTSTIAGNSLVRSSAGPGKQDIPKQVTSVVANEIGLPGKTSLNSEDIDAQKANLGDRIDSLAGQLSINTRTNPAIGNQVAGELKNLYVGFVPQISTTTPASVQKIMGNLNVVRNLINAPGDIPGKAVQSLIRKGGPIWAMTQDQDPLVKYYGNQLRGTLMDGLDATAASQGSSPVAAEYKNVRNQYRLAATVEPAVDKSGSGVLDPKKIGNLFAGAPPGTPLKTIADAANAGLLSPPKGGSGALHTPVRVAADLAGAGAGAMLGLSQGPFEAAAGGVLGGLTAEGIRAAGSAALHGALNSNPYRAAMKAGGGHVPLAKAAPGLSNLYTQPNTLPAAQNQ